MAVKNLAAMAGGAPAPEEEMENPEEGAESGEEENTDQSEELEEGELAKYAPVMDLMEPATELIEEGLQELDKKALTSDAPLEEGQVQGLIVILGHLDDALIKALPVLDGITIEDAMELGEQLVDEGKASDADLIGGFLFHANEALPGLQEILASEGEGDAQASASPTARMMAAEAPQE